MQRVLVFLALLLPMASSAGSFIRLPSPPKEEAPAAPAAEAVAPATAPSEAKAAAPPAKAAEASADEAPETDQADPGIEADLGRAEPQGEPTYGEACIYGPHGLVYEPRDTECPERAERETKRVSGKPATGRGGACIIGAGGQIVYQPDGVECEGKVRAPLDPSAKRPRGRRYRP